MATIDKAAINFIYFDVGKVLLRQKVRPQVVIAEKLGIAVDKVDSALDYTVKLNDFEKKYFAIRTLNDQDAFNNTFAEHFYKNLGLPFNIKNLEIYKSAWTRQVFELMPGAIEILDYLSKQYRLGIISNALPSRRYFELVEHKLMPYFDPIILSHEVGIHKPAPGIFKMAMELAGTGARNTAFVDDLTGFLEGAYRAGTKNLFQYRGDKLTTTIDPENYKYAVLITDLLELKNYL